METDLGLRIHIEPIGEEHIESFHRCLDSIAKERKFLAFIKAPSLESTRDFILANIANNVPAFIASHEGDVVGFCDIRPNHLEGFKHSGTLGMGVLKKYRRQGIGQKLTEKTISLAWQQGLERIELEVFSSNTPAINLYKKLGFKVEGVKKMARKLDGVYDDLVEMALLVN